MDETEVLIAGAGPTGLVLALWLSKLGVRVRIVDKTAAPGTTSRALAVQARTLELYRQLDLADAVVADGHAVPALNVWAEGVPRAQVSLHRVLEGMTPYPNLLIYPQDRHERLLIDRLAAFGVHVERETELTAFTQHADGIDAQLRSADGTPTRCTARYLAGCDSARSAVRKSLDVGFPGGTYSRIFYVADIDGTGPAMNGELHLNFDQGADFLAVFPLAPQGRARLIGTVLDAHAERLDTLTFDDISANAIARLKIEVTKVNWFSTYRVHHRVADHFRTGRAFLLGDAAHIHSPAGGQGMNTGIGDAINLAWKLAAVLRQQATPALLDTYEPERRTFARRLVATTDQAFTFATSEGGVAQFARKRMVPVVVPLAARIPALRRFMFRTVSQLSLHYPDSALSGGKAGRIYGGDRLPWVAAGGVDNFAPLTAIAWQVHVYGAAPAALAAWCGANGIALHSFAWTPAHAHAGLARDAAYLVRPDTYVALADAHADAGTIERWLRANGIALPVIANQLADAAAGARDRSAG